LKDPHRKVGVLRFGEQKDSAPFAW
jgi:hypothetical protein